MSIRFHCTCGRSFKVSDDAAGKKAKCLQCGKVLTVPHPQAASGSAPPGPPARPAAPRPAQPPPIPAAGDIPVARAIEEDDIPMAQLAETAKTHHVHMATPRRRSGGLGPVKVVLALSILVGFALAMDVIIPLATAVRQPGGVSSSGWWHGLWLVFLVIGFFMAAAAARGSRFCIGVLIGGAFRGVINGGVILVFVLAGEKLWVAWPQWMMVYGIAALGLACVYLVCLLIAGETRRHLSGHGGTVAGAAVMGAILGGILAPTALPDPLFLLSRTLARPEEAVRALVAMGATELIGEEERERITNRVKGQLGRIGTAMQTYIDDNVGYLPDNLGELVGLKDCKAEDFLAPGSALGVPERDEKTGAFKGPIDIKLVLGGYHQYDLPEDAAEAGLLIVCYSDPNCHFRDGALVLRPLNARGDRVQWLPKAQFADQLHETHRWMKRHPPRARVRAAEEKKPAPAP